MPATLNPHAAPFVPLAYCAVEDFSQEWWELVKSSPWFRDFWLRECFNEENVDDVDHKDLELTDIYDFLFHPSDAQQKGEEKKKTKKNKCSSGRMELMAWGADKWMETRCRPWDASCCSEKTPKIVSLRVTPRTIQQPR